MDNDGDSDDDADDDSDYDYDESGDLEMEFDEDVDESAEYDPESEEEADIAYNLADQSVESTWSLWHADSDEQEYGYYVESDQENQPDNSEDLEGDESDADYDVNENGTGAQSSYSVVEDLEGDPEYTYDSPTPEAGIYDDGRSVITFHTHNDDEHGSQRHSRHIDDKGRGTHNQDERKRSRYSRPEPDYYSDYDDEDEDEYEEEDEERDTPWNIVKRMLKSSITLTPMEDDDG